MAAPHFVALTNCLTPAALTTGTVPSFADVITNLGATALVEDSWLAQVQRHGGRLVFYGDDTWLKLFPSTFLRAEGTTSFFVAVRDPQQPRA